MTEHARASENLTGVWHGLYTYPGGQPVSFVATLIETGSALSGTVHEPRVFGKGADATLYATLHGSRNGNAVTFVKTYDGAGAPYDRAVSYDGTLSADATEIEGRWRIPGNWSGKFLMIRSAGRQEEVSRTVFERA
jgi:hypothetical protein